MSKTQLAGMSLRALDGVEGDSRGALAGSGGDDGAGGDVGRAGVRPAGEMPGGQDEVRVHEGRRPAQVRRDGRDPRKPTDPTACVTKVTGKFDGGKV